MMVFFALAGGMQRGAAAQTALKQHQVLHHAKHLPGSAQQLKMHLHMCNVQTHALRALALLSPCTSTLLACMRSLASTSSLAFGGRVSLHVFLLGCST
jgi:hypothetical protein